MGVFTFPVRVYWEDTDAGGVVYYNCGGVFYKPHYQSANLVYVVVPAP